MTTKQQDAVEAKRATEPDPTPPPLVDEQGGTPLDPRAVIDEVGRIDGRVLELAVERVRGRILYAEIERLRAAQGD